MAVVGIEIGNDGIVENVSFLTNTETAISSAGDYVRISNCYQDAGTIFYEATAGNNGVQISGVIAESKGIVLGGCDYSHITDCYLGYISGTGNGSITIADNYLYGRSLAVAGISLTSFSFSKITGNTVDTNGAQGIYLNGATDVIVTDNIVGAGLPTVGIKAYFGDDLIIANNHVSFIGGHGIHLDLVNNSEVHDNHIHSTGRTTTNTYDGIFVDANSDNNSIQSNTIRAAATGNVPRYGINIAAATCDNNIVTGNQLTPSAGFGTAPYNDAGTGTINTYPAHVTYGDNFT